MSKVIRSCLLILALLPALMIKLNAQTVILSETFGGVAANSSYHSDTLASGVSYIQCKTETSSSGTCSAGALLMKKNAQGTQGIVELPVLESVSNLSFYFRSTSPRNVELQKQASDNSWVLVANYLIENGTCGPVWSPSEAYSDVPVKYRLACTATDGDIRLYEIQAISAGGISTLKEITYFSLFEQKGKITSNATSGTIDLTVPYGTNLTSVEPDSIGLSRKATISPLANMAQDFSQPVTYTVTAEDASTKMFVVTVSIAAPSTGNDISSCKIAGRNGVVDKTAGTVLVTVPNGTNLSNLIPVITVSPDAIISPASGVAQNFTSPVTYTVTAQNGTSKTYTITIQEGSITPVGDIPDWSKPVGFASIDGDNFTGPATGGGKLDSSQNIIYINGPSDFTKLVTLLYDRIKAYKNKSDYLTAKYAPLIIVLEEGLYPETGDIANTGSVWGNSMLTIEDQGDLTIIGRGNVVLNFGINVKRSYNVLIRNITFQDYYDDGINIGEPETHHVWVDHCTLGNPATMPANTEHPDGGCDIKNGASYITVSWCLFRNSWKTSLVGHSDNNGSTDIDRLKVTYYCDYFYSSNSRHPRVRFGEVHVLNCFYENVKLYGIVSANSAKVYAEGNFFLNTVFPMYADRTETDFAAVFAPLLSYTGNYPCIGLKQVNNKYDDSGLTTVLTGNKVNTNMLNPGGKSIKFDELHPELVFDPKTYYNYSALDAADVPTLVRTYAGAGAVDFFAEEITPTSIYIASKYKMENMKIYPSPVVDELTIADEAGWRGKIKIISSMGRVVFEKEVNSFPYTINLREAGIQKGLYIVTLENEYGQEKAKLLVQ